jgi:type VI secretion system secreted protein VgrG
MQVYNVVAVIEIDGTPVDNYYSIEIKQHFNKHHQFSITMPHEVIETKGSFSLNNVKNLIGKVAIIRFQKGSKGTALNEFKGIIADVGIGQSTAFHSQVVLRGFSPTIILDSGPHTTCFIRKDIKKISQEATKDISGECKVTINPTNTKAINYFTQYKESHFDFLNRLSAEFGEWFFYNGKELFFGKPSNSPNVDMIVGEDITSINLRLQLLPSSIKSFSYQSKDDKVLTGTTPSQVSGLGMYAKHALSESDKLFTPVTSGVINPRVETKTELDNLLKIKKTAIASQLEVVSGESVNPEIVPGTIATIKISKLDNNNFSLSEFGKYLITSVSHTLSEDGKYTNTFEGLPSTVEVVRLADYKKPVAEPQVGVVKDNKDPDNLGRVKVTMIWHDQNVSTDWIRVMTADGGKGEKNAKNRGFVFIPEVGDQVMVGFRYNDPDRPFVMGSLFHGKTAGGGGKDNRIKTLSTNKGNTITMDDEKGSMKLEDVKGNSVLIDGTGKININCTEQIELKTGDSSITLKKDGTILITGKMKVEVKSDQAVNIEGTSKVDVKSSQAVNIEGTTEVAMKGTNIAVKANANLDLAANANLSAKATANLALEGTAMAKLSSAAMAEITAAMVKIN